MSADTAGSATAHRVDTDLTGEKVRSYPATAVVRGFDSSATAPASSRASAGKRPCSRWKNSRATSDRTRARSASGTGQSPGSPAAALTAAIRAATSRRYGLTSGL
jgi:hypothetical protein